MWRKVHESTDSVPANLDDIFEKRQISDDPYRPNRKWAIYAQYKAVIAMDRSGKEGPWLLTAYIPDSWKETKSPSTGPTSIGARGPQAQETRSQVSTDREIIHKKRLSSNRKINHSRSESPILILIRAHGIPMTPAYSTRTRQKINLMVNKTRTMIDEGLNPTTILYLSRKRAL